MSVYRAADLLESSPRPVTLEFTRGESAEKRRVTLQKSSVNMGKVMSSDVEYASRRVGDVQVLALFFPHLLLIVFLLLVFLLLLLSLSLSLLLCFVLRSVPLAGLFAGRKLAGLSPAKCPAKNPAKIQTRTPKFLPARISDFCWALL